MIRSQITVDETMTCKLEFETDIAFHASPGWRIIVIGDQHGEIGLMRQLLELATGLKTTAPQTKIVYLGDLIDRGPDSLACLDLAISSQTFSGIDAVGNVCGNHEEMLGSTKVPPLVGCAGPFTCISLALPADTVHSSCTVTIQTTDDCLMLRWSIAVA